MRVVGMVSLVGVIASGCWDELEPRPELGSTAAAFCCGNCCNISGECIPSGTTNPLDACEVCSPSRAGTSWSDKCDDGLFCNGSESCAAGACSAGTPPVVDDDGIDCTVDRCDESSDQIVHDPDDSDCDDGAFCNGAETCHATLGCRSGTPPALSDGIPCTTDACDEAADEVTHTPNDASCDDGMFCNGEETCDESTGCVSGTPPDTDDGVDCTVDDCDDSADEITHIAVDADCDDGDPCTADSCDLVDGCANQSITGCCTVAGECDDLDDCTMDACIDNACAHFNVCFDAGVADADAGVDAAPVAPDATPPDARLPDATPAPDAAPGQPDATPPPPDAAPQGIDAAAGAPDAAAADAAPVIDDGDDGCGCRAADTEGGPLGVALLALLVAPATSWCSRRRARSRRRRGRRTPDATARSRAR